MKIILDEDAATFLYEKWEKWESVASERDDFPNWKRSSIEREERRESIVYGNCAADLCQILRTAVNKNGEIWWSKLHTPNKRNQPRPVPPRLRA